MRLNVGCGDYLLDGFVNLDADPATPADVHADAMVYLRDCPDATFAEVYAGHFLEHLAPEGAQRFLAECYRVLAPGGACAIVVPDTYEVLRRYVARRDECVPIEGKWWNLSDLDAVCAAFLYSPIQPTPHRWSYDIDTLARAMRAAGFMRLRQIDRERDPHLAAPAWFQCGVEGVKGEAA